MSYGDMMLCRIAELTDDARDDLAALSQAVYPPEASANWLGRYLEWTAPEAGVFIRDAAGKLVCYVGMVIRSARHEGRPVQIGGIGGVKTYPAARRQGLAAQAISRAMEFFREQTAIDFGLLVCEPHLVDYYSRLGWEKFAGRLLITQHGKPAEFTFNRVMVRGVRRAIPTAGTIDLLGPPW